MARIGGDEFAVLLPQTDAEQAQIVADEMVKALGRQMAVLADQSIHITASVGVAMFDGLTDIEVLAYADLAMYEAKETGRNRVAMYRPITGRRERVSARLAEAERIRRALEEDRLLLYCQPILDLDTNEICQYELLLRLPDDEGGEPLPPSAFLYVAERSGLIQAIDGWVVRKAIALIAEHARAGLEARAQRQPVGQVDRRPQARRAHRRRLGRVRNRSRPSDLRADRDRGDRQYRGGQGLRHRLRGRGCQFALDDFGAGFGSFYYLKNLPFDYLKIDGDFIRGLATSPMDQLVVDAIVSIARGMGKKTVAEFVGDEESARLLRKIGVDHAQGYHIGMPRPVSELYRRPAKVRTR